MSSTQKLPPVTNGNDGAKTVLNHGARSDFQLDVPKLHSLPSEQQDLYLFTFVTDLERHIASLSPEPLKVQQVHFKRELLQVITLPTPSPTRVIRNSLGRCFGCIFGNGDRKLLFETITELGDFLGSLKGDKETRNKQAAVHCLGEIYNVAGDGVINLSSSTCFLLLRLLKAAGGHVALRAAIFKGLGKIIAAIKSSLEESVAKDIWKQARSAASGDRAYLVQVAACWCLEQLIRSTTYCDTTVEFESLKITIWKVGDTSCCAVRRASASCLASIMIKAYTDTVAIVPIPKTPMFKRPKKPSPGQNLSVADGDDSDSMRIASPTWKKNSAKLELTFSDILRQLSVQYVRSSTTNKSRATIICCYKSLLVGLNPELVESNYGIIADSLLVDILNNPLIAQHRYRLLLTRRFVHELLAGVVCRLVLGEAAQIDAARSLINDYIKNYPRVIKERTEPSKATLTGALHVLASIIHSLGSAFSPLSDSAREGLLQVLQHPSYTVQIHASYCLRLFTLTCPSQLIPCASVCMNSLNRELGLLSTGRHSSRRCIGYANGLAAVLSISSLQPLYSSLEISSRVLQQATNLLKSSVSSELRISRTQVQVAWILIGGLMSLGPNFVKIHLSQLLLLWRNSLPKALTRENAGQRPDQEIRYLVHVRECALGSILSFLEFNGRLLTTDVSKRIAMMLHNTIEFLEHLPASKPDGEILPRPTPSLQLNDIMQMVRRRVLQCLTRLAVRSPHTSTETLSQSSLLTFAVSCFAEPEAYLQGSLGTSIANSASNFDSIWNVADNYGFGISGIMKGLYIKPLPAQHLQTEHSYWHRQTEVEDILDQLVRRPRE